MITGTSFYPPDPPREVITIDNMGEWRNDMVDAYHPPLEEYEGTGPLERTFYKYHKYRPLHFRKPVLKLSNLKLQKLKNLKLAVGSKLKSKLKSKLNLKQAVGSKLKSKLKSKLNLKLALKSKLKSKPLLKLPKLKKLKFKGLHKPKPSYRPHSSGRPSYKPAPAQEPIFSYETTSQPTTTTTTTTSHPTYVVSYSPPVYEEPTSYKPIPKSPPSTSLAPAYSPPYRPPPVLEAYSRPAQETQPQSYLPVKEGFVEVASRVPEQPLPAAWEEDFGPRLEELLDLEARVNNAKFPSVNSFTDNFSTTFVWGPPQRRY